MKESNEAKHQKVREEAVATVSREVLSECKVKVDATIEAVEEAQRADKVAREA